MSDARVSFNLPIPIASPEPPESEQWVLVKDHRWADADTYRGQASVLTATFKGPPEQILPTRIAAMLIDKVESTVKGSGGKSLEIKIWADTRPTWITRYKIEYTLVDPETDMAPMKQGIARMQAVQLIILAVLAAVVVIGLVLLAHQVTKINFGPGGLTGALGIGLLIILAVAFMGGKKGAQEKKHG